MILPIIGMEYKVVHAPYQNRTLFYAQPEQLTEVAQNATLLSNLTKVAAVNPYWKNTHSLKFLHDEDTFWIASLCKDQVPHDTISLFNVTEKGFENITGFLHLIIPNQDIPKKFLDFMLLKTKGYIVYNGDPTEGLKKMIFVDASIQENEQIKKIRMVCINAFPLALETQYFLNDTFTE